MLEGQREIERATFHKKTSVVKEETLNFELGKRIHEPVAGRREGKEGKREEAKVGWKARCKALRSLKEEKSAGGKTEHGGYEKPPPRSPAQSAAGGRASAVGSG